MKFLSLSLANFDWKLSHYVFDDVCLTFVIAMEVVTGHLQRSPLKCIACESPFTCILVMPLYFELQVDESATSDVVSLRRRQSSDFRPRIMPDSTKSC